MASEKVQWQTASPLWEEALKDAGGTKKRFNRPAILRFATDTFMEDLEGILKTRPAGLADTVVRYETWEEEGAGWLTEAGEAAEKTPLKLYHPAHGRFYLVAAGLSCRKPGFPDKCLDTGNKETVSFVMRRLVYENGKQEEYGWMGSSGWQKVGVPLTVPAGEERLPLFAMNYMDRDRGRRLLAGLVPVSSRETFQAPPNLNPLTIPAEELETAEDNDDPLADLRMARFEGSVVDGMIGLRERLKNYPDKIGVPGVQEVFLFCLYDFAYFIETYLDGDASSISGLDTKIFFEYEENATTVTITWSDALNDVMAGQNMENIMLGTITDPGFISPQFIAVEGEIKNNIKSAIDNLGILSASGDTYEFAGSFKTGIENALPEIPVDQVMAGEPVPEVPKNEPGVFYVVRCVYERPRCQGIHSPVVSEPSRAFQLASFFDPDAPARPVNITLPENTGIAGLRKFKKNVSVLVSKKLRNQMERMTGLKLGDVDDGNIPKEKEPGFNLGMICSLSIPIITICALLLLMIIVSLLNIVFWWLPFFKICFPKKT